MSSRSLGQLTLSLVAQIGGFEAGLSKAARVSEQRMKQIRDSATKLGRNFGIAFTAAAGGLAVLVKNQLDAADEMGKLAQSTGVAIGALSELSYAAELSGVEDLGGALVKFNKIIDEASEGSKAQAQLFRDLGISVKDAQGNVRGTEDLFADVAQAISEMDDGAKKTATSMALFGKSGANLVPLLNAGREGINGMRGDARALGLTLDEYTGKAAEAFNDNLATLQKVATGLGVRLASNLAPALASASGYMVDLAKDTDAVKEAADGLAIAFKTVVLGTSALGNLAQSSVRALVHGTLAEIELLKGNFSGAYDELAAASEGIVGDVDDVRKAYEALFGVVGNVPSAPRPRGGGGGGGSDSTRDEAAEAARKQAESIRDLIDSLKEESATIGLGNAQLKARQVALLGGTSAQQEEIFHLAKFVDLQKQALEDDEARKRIIEQTLSPLEQYREQIAELNRLFDDGKSDPKTYARAVRDVQDQFEELGKVVETVGKTSDDTFDQIASAADQAARNIQTAFADFLFDPFDKGLKGMLQSFSQTVQRMVAEQAAADIFGVIKTSGSGGLLDFFLGLGGGLGGSTPYGGAKALGGPVMPGKAYLVGEQGPEMFMPKSAGTIIPNGAGGTIVNNFTIQAPAGTVSKATQMQVGAAAARGAARASGRNN